MKDIKTLWVGQSVYVGVQKPKKARVWAEPFESNGWKVPVEHLNGVRENVPLFMVYAREVNEPRTLLKDLVKAVAPEIGAEELRRGLKKWGLG